MEAKIVLLDRPHSAAELSAPGPLDLRNISASAFAEILAQCHVATLRLYNIKIAGVDGIERLDSVTDLTLHWASKLTSLDPVFRMHRLHTLRIVDCARVAEVQGIEQLTGLRRLTLAGGMWRAMRLASLRPAAAIRSLEELTLQNLRLGDDDVTSLVGLDRLRSLTLSNQFERAQVAVLAKHLNGRLAVPLTASVPSSLICRKCGGFMHMFTGRRMPFLCAACDRPRFERLTREFDGLVEAS